MPEEHDLDWLLTATIARWIAWMFTVPFSIGYIIDQQHFDFDSIVFVVIQTVFVTLALLVAWFFDVDVPKEKEKREETEHLGFRRGSGVDVPSASQKGVGDGRLRLPRRLPPPTEIDRPNSASGRLPFGRKPVADEPSPHNDTSMFRRGGMFGRRLPETVATHQVVIEHDVEDRVADYWENDEGQHILATYPYDDAGDWRQYYRDQNWQLHHSIDQDTRDW